MEGIDRNRLFNKIEKSIEPSETRDKILRLVLSAPELDEEFITRCYECVNWSSEGLDGWCSVFNVKTYCKYYCGDGSNDTEEMKQSRSKFMKREEN